MDNAKDTRNIATGWEIPTENYCDQPYIVKTDDGAWLCVLTTGTGNEGQPGQHIVTIRSTDLGRTWSAPVDVEPPELPESSYAALLKIPTGRMYCFYNHNTDNIREVIADDPPYPGGKCKRVDSQGYFVVKYSDDHGCSWSEKRYTIPIREMDIDRQNPYGGKIQFFWNVGKPFIQNNAAYVSVHKVGGFGHGFFTRSEGILLKSNNILTESEPDKITWETLPDGDFGLHTPPDGGPVAEEQSYVVLNDGSFYSIYRTIDGFPCHAYSRDEGRTWVMEYATYTPGGRRIKHPRAANFVWKCENAKYLYWFHNNGTNWYNHGPCAGNRNVAWLSGGIEKDGFIHWSQPEIVLYEDNRLRGASYPDLIEDNGRYFISATQKTEARVWEIDQTLIEGLWEQGECNSVVQEGCVLDLSDCSDASVKAPTLPSLSGEFRGKHGISIEGRGGFTLDLWINFCDLVPGQILIDGRDDSGKGYVLTTTDRQTIRFEMCDGWMGIFWECDSGLLRLDADHHVVVIVDGGPKVISFVVDGLLCDGGQERLFGWGRLSPYLQDINGAETLRIAPKLKGTLKKLRIYNRYLRTSEAISNFKAGYTD